MVLTGWGSSPSGAMAFLTDDREALPPDASGVRREQLTFEECCERARRLWSALGCACHVEVGGRTFELEAA